MTIRCILRLGLAAAAILAGCTSHDMVTTASRPGKFRLYNCEQLDKKGFELSKRERELDGLMQKAKQGPGGEIAIAIAYQSEYNVVQGDLREVELTGTERNCVLKYRTISERVIR